MPPSRRAPTADELAAALAAVGPWVRGETGSPPRPTIAAAVRSSLRTLERVAPGHSVEVRVPPYGAVQCVAGPHHTRGTPPNVVETDAVTWLALAVGYVSWTGALDEGRLRTSGHRAGEVARWLPVGRSTPSSDDP